MIPNQQYKDLGPDDVIQEGDETLDFFTGQWRKVSGHEIGNKLSNFNLYKFRRPIPVQEVGAGKEKGEQTCSHDFYPQNGLCAYCGLSLTDASICDLQRENDLIKDKERLLALCATLQRENEELRKSREIIEWIFKKLESIGLSRTENRGDDVYIYGCMHVLAGAHLDVKKYIECNARVGKENEELRKSLYRTKKHLADANRGAERQQKVNMIHCETINTLHSQLTAANERAEKAERILARKGYRKSCDIAACNCGDNWSHGGHAEERLHEIADEVWENGKTALQSVKDLKAMLESAETSLATAQKEIEGLRGALLPLLAESVSVLEHLDNYIKQSEDGWFCSCCGEGLEGDGGHREDCLVNKALNMSTPCMNAEKAIGNLTGEQVLKYALRLALTPKPEAKG